MKQFMRRRQQGMTFIGLLCVLVLCGIIGYAGVRLVPVYLNYMKLARTMESAATEFKGESGALDGVRKSLDRHWAIEDITAVDQKDIEITRDDSGLTLHVAYDDTVPYIANISLSVHFDKTVKVQ
jgi:type II secretory pathway pseudopilin PulG